MKRTAARLHLAGLVLSAIALRPVPVDADGPTTLALTYAAATFEQSGWPGASAFDGDTVPTTSNGWSVFGIAGSPAYIELVATTPAMTYESGGRLAFSLVQSLRDASGALLPDNIIGAFDISYTTDATPTLESAGGNWTPLPSSGGSITVTGAGRAGTADSTHSSGGWFVTTPASPVRSVTAADACVPIDLSSYIGCTAATFRQTLSQSGSLPVDFKVLPCLTCSSCPFGTALGSTTECGCSTSGFIHSALGSQALAPFPQGVASPGGGTLISNSTWSLYVSDLAAMGTSGTLDLEILCNGTPSTYELNYTNAGAAISGITGFRLRVFKDSRLSGTLQYGWGSGSIALTEFQGQYETPALASIPTLSEWGMILMALGLGVAIFSAMRRRATVA